MTTAFKMTNKARFAARSLAIRYSAFNDALRSGDDENIAFWGEMLIEAQNKAGIEFYTPQKIRDMSDDEQSSRFTMSRGPDGETRLSRQA